MAIRKSSVADPADAAPAPALAPLPAGLHLFGIRHHGPGSARSLRQALDALQPDCVLVEGPPEAEPLIPLVLHEQLCPPVALLSHCPDEPRQACYHPFALFSPEWQALRWAAARGVPARFIDLPLTHGLALAKAEQERLEKAIADDTLERAAQPAEPDVGAETDPSAWADPLDWLARAAGHADGEAWWNHMVEERGDGTALFAAIDEAMSTLRAELHAPPLPPAEAQREALREAQMRQCVREAQKEGFERIAVVVGAWHLGGLRGGLAARGGAKADAALLKGLPKLKVSCTWVPWTYRHLTRASGYGAGIAAPGWYEHLWHSAESGQPRTVGWMARIARLMRERDLDCSSAHLIEASRLADTLAALRGRPAASLDELSEAACSVLALGDATLLRFIDDALVVGDRLGSVPPDVPAVPLQRDLERLQKSLRLKPEALQRTLDLDLRQPTDLARSQLLHRLRLLDLPWGEPARGAASARGTFHELWTLQWQPEFALRLIEASVWGQTVDGAACARAIDRAAQAADLPALAALVDRVLLADLAPAVLAVTDALAQRAALCADLPQMLAALPDLARVFRYGNVRQTDATLVARVLDSLALRAAIALPLACQALDDEAADKLREQLLGAHGAVLLRDQEELRSAWQQALAQIAGSVGAHALLQGLATRLLLDGAVWSAEPVAAAMALHLSAGSEPARAAAWLDGFLNRNATVLLHDAGVWQLVDDWLMSLGEAHFLRVLPLVRRSFSTFAPGELRDLGQRARQGRRAAAPALSATPDWDAARAALPVPLLRQLLGLAPPPAAAANPSGPAGTATAIPAGDQTP